MQPLQPMTRDPPSLTSSADAPRRASLGTCGAIQIPIQQAHDTQLNIKMPSHAGGEVLQATC